MLSKTSRVNKLARNYFVEEWNNNKIRIHSECVIEACLNTIRGTDLKDEVFIIAGWIHDIGRKIDKENHHKLSLKFLHKFLQEYPEFNSIKKEVTDCIVNHRKNGNPKSVYGIVFQASDKVALNNKKWLNFKKKNTNKQK